MLAGALCVWQLPIAEFPEVAPPTIVVSANYPGAGAEVIAETIAAPLEAEINGVENLLYYASTSDNRGSYSLTLTFAPGTHADIALVNVTNAIKRTEPKLPREATMYGVNVMKRTADFLGVIAFTSDNPNHTALFLSNYISINVKDAVSRIDGVGQAMIFNERSYSMRIWLDPLRMRALGIGHEEIQAAIRGQNVQAATGSVGNEGSSPFMQFKVDTRGRLREASEFGNIVVRSGNDGRQVRLSDIARIELGADVYSGTPLLNSRPAVMLAIFKVSDANALAVVNGITRRIDGLVPQFPDGMRWQFSYDSTTFVRETMKEIATTLGLTFFLVVVITFLFLQDWRATIVPTVAIPISLLGTFLFLALFGMGINTLTMFGLILVIGSVVDDAICVVECCMRLIHEERLSPQDAAFRAMRELTGAMIATTLVVIAIYAPIAFFGGMVGTIYRQFAITMCVALSISTLVALTLSPAMCALVLREQRHPARLFRWFNTGLFFARGLYLGVASFLVRRVVVTLLVLAVILWGNYSLYQRLPTAFLPREDRGTIFCEVILPPGATLARTEAVLTDFMAKIEKIDGVRLAIGIPGRSVSSGEGENMVRIVARLHDWSERRTPETSIAAIQAAILRLGADIPDARVQAFVPPAIQGMGSVGGVTFALQATSGQTMQEIAEASAVVIKSLKESGQVASATTSLNARTPILRLHLDREKAEAMNVRVGAVFSTLQSQLGSLYVNDFNLYGKTYRVKIQSESAYRDSPNRIGELTVRSESGANIPLDALATLEQTVGPQIVERFNMFPAVNIQSQTASGVSSGELMRTIEEIVRRDLPSGFQMSWTGLSDQESRNSGHIVVLIVLAIVFAYLFLVAQYESWTTPVSVMLSVAAATLGGLAALTLTGMAMDIYCQLGLLVLIGLTAKTSILMAEYAKQLRDNGLGLTEAALTAMRVRFRAVLMTALSFVVGVSPMVVAMGAGAGGRRSIGVTLFWGMLLATVLGMVLVPALFVFSRAVAESVHRLWWKEMR